MNRDLFTNVPVKRAASAAMAVINGVQDLPPHEQMVGLAAAFLLLAEHWGVPAQDAFQITKNVMNHAEGRRPEFAAVRMYVENEL